MMEKRVSPDLRVLHCVASIDPKLGGVSQAIRSMIDPLAELECENSIVSLDTHGSHFSGWDRAITHFLGPGIGPWGYCGQLNSWLAENMERFDVIVIHGLWLYPSHCVTRAVRQLKRRGSSSVPRVFVMPHGMLDPWFQRDPSRRLKAYRNWAFWKAIEHRVISDADGMLFTCQQELELARIPFRPYRPRTEFNVGLGVESPPAFKESMIPAFLEAVPGLRSQNYFLFLSRIHPKKGVDLLLRAYARVVSEARDSYQAPALVIAGPLDSDYTRRMQQLAADSNLNDVHFPGMLSGDAKWGAFYGCEAFVLPSHQENFGIAVVEALACGKPVLISNQVNICTEIKADNAGFVEPDTLAGTQRLLERFLDLTASERLKLASKASECFEKRFGIETAAKKFCNTIQSFPQSP